MRRLSRIIHLSKSGNLIVRLDSDLYPRIGAKVFDSKLKEIGKVQDLFGPVARPYISISPTVSEASTFVGRIIYSD